MGRQLTLYYDLSVNKELECIKLEAFNNKLHYNAIKEKTKKACQFK